MKQRVPKPRTSLPLEDQVFIAVLRTADALSQQAEQVVRARGLTGAQYNVLRILRGAEPEGCACREIGEVEGLAHAEGAEDRVRRKGVEGLLCHRLDDQAQEECIEITVEHPGAG